MAYKKGAININQLAKVLSEELQDYGYIAETTVTKAIERVSDETVRVLQDTSPYRTGEYARNWMDEERYRPRAHNYARVVYNADTYRLTHLLENGHASRNGGRVAPKPHIRTAERLAVTKVYDEIKRELTK